MYLEVTVKTKKTIAYDAYNKTEIVIGSLPTCDLILNDPSVSRKHSKIFFTEGKWFASDLGSTNGTHYEGKQIVPGQRQEIQLQVPIRLGHKVEIALVKEAKDAQPLYNSANLLSDGKEKKDDKTRVISLAKLKAAQDASDKKKLKKKQEKRLFDLKAKKAEKQRTVRTLLIVFVIIVGGIVGNSLWKKHQDADRREGIAKKLQSKKGSSEEIDADVEGFRIARVELLTRNTIIGLLNGPKCRTEAEKEFCDKLAFLTLGHNGYLEPKPQTMLSMLEETPWLKRVNELIKGRAGLDRQTKYKIAFLLILKEYFINIQEDLDVNSNVYVAFYSVAETGLILSGTGAIKVTNIPTLAEMYDESSFSNPKISIPELLNDLSYYYTYY